MRVLGIDVGGSKTISLSKYVQAPGGYVRLTTRDTLHATPPGAFTLDAHGSKELVIRAPRGYRGPGAVHRFGIRIQ